jgi:hypothetical protein
MLLGQSAVAERSWWNGPDDHGGMSPLISRQPISDRAHRGGMPPGGIPPGDHTDSAIATLGSEKGLVCLQNPNRALIELDSCVSQLCRSNKPSFRDVLVVGQLVSWDGS